MTRVFGTGIGRLLAFLCLLAFATAAIPQSRSLTMPPKKAGFWVCKARADCDDNVPNNCPKDPARRFAFGDGVAKSQGDARNMAKKDAVHTLAVKKVKHVSCKCIGPKGEKYEKGC